MNPGEQYMLFLLGNIESRGIGGGGAVSRVFVVTIVGVA